MITESSLYWITRLNSIINFATASACLCALMLVVSVGALANNTDEILPSTGVKLTAVLSFIFAVLFSLVLVFTPTMKEMCVIKVIPAIINSEKNQAVGNEFYTLAVDWLREIHPTNFTESVKGQLRNGLDGVLK